MYRKSITFLHDTNIPPGHSYISFGWERLSKLPWTIPLGNQVLFCFLWVSLFLCGMFSLPSHCLSTLRVLRSVLPTTSTRGRWRRPGRTVSGVGVHSQQRGQTATGRELKNRRAWSSEEVWSGLRELCKRKARGWNDKEITQGNVPLTDCPGERDPGYTNAPWVPLSGSYSGCRAGGHVVVMPSSLWSLCLSHALNTEGRLDLHTSWEPCFMDLTFLGRPSFSSSEGRDLSVFSWQAADHFLLWEGVSESTLSPETAHSTLNSSNN